MDFLNAMNQGENMRRRIEITPVKGENEKLYKKVINTIMTLIDKGELEYGDKLYNEEQLIKKLNVSRSTLREALRVLEFMDVLTVAPKRGIVINDPRNRMDYPPLSFILQFEKIPMKEVVELRSSLEMQALVGAIRNTDADYAKELKELKEEFLGVDTLQERVVIDKRIHFTIVEMSGNITLFKLYNTFRTFFYEQLEDAVYQAYREDGDDRIKMSHANLIDAILEQDLHHGMEALNYHFEGALKRYVW
jgi:GntR family transcriptional repressor for pyruvate dehydrogenase complex